jgi:hypothetical protein
MTQPNNNGKPTTGTFRTIADGGFIGKPPTSAPARPEARRQPIQTAKPAKPRMDDAVIDAAINSAMRKMEKGQAGQASAADALARIRLTQRQLLAQVAGVPVDQVETLRHE